MIKKSRLREALKTAAIALLTISALALGSAVGLYSHVFSIADTGGRANQNTQPASLNYAEAAVPFVVAVTNAASERYCAKNDNAMVRQVYVRTGVLLAEALGSSEEPQPVSEDEWREALSGASVFFDFLYAQPLDALAAWLGTDVGSGARNHTARRFCLAETEEALALYFISGGDGLYYRCETALGGGLITAGFEEYVPNGAKFVFEYGASLSEVDSYTLIMDKEPITYEVAAKSPVYGPLSEDGLSEIFGMELALRYIEPDGAVLFVDAVGETLRISSDGTVTYKARENTGVQLERPGGLETAAGVIDAALDFCRNGVLSHRADAELGLSGMTFDRTLGEYTITFEYIIRGIPVRLGGGSAARLHISSDGRITAATLLLREFSAAKESAGAEWDLQIAAILQISGGGEPILVYAEDGGAADRVKARWVENR